MLLHLWFPLHLNKMYRGAHHVVAAMVLAALKRGEKHEAASA